MKWVPEYNTGIDVIDDQHKRILDYINEINDVAEHTDRARIKQILENIIDYTQSHFTFEESFARRSRVINTAYHINVSMIYLLRRESYRDRFEMGQALMNSMNFKMAD